MSIIDHIKIKQKTNLGKIEDKLYKQLLNLRQPFETTGILNEQAEGER